MDRFYGEIPVETFGGIPEETPRVIQEGIPKNSLAKCQKELLDVTPGRIIEKTILENLRRNFFWFPLFQ